MFNKDYIKLINDEFEKTGATFLTKRTSPELFSNFEDFGIVHYLRQYFFVKTVELKHDFDHVLIRKSYLD
ncbi:hypothetical protein D931_02339 [Enterococcus faecium 13.SD.W.09]|nr:hypothetical protein D931_02339 [Enterococcus faecium 13.SD.W.09]